MTTEKKETTSTTVVEAKEEPKKATKSKKSEPDFEQKVEEGQESTLRNWVIDIQYFNEDGSMEWKSHTVKASSEKEVLRLVGQDGLSPYRLVVV